MRALAWLVLLSACDAMPALDAGLADAGHDAGPAAVRPPVGVYSEFLAYDAVEATLPALAARGAALQLAVPSATIGVVDLAALLRAAETAGVEVRIWLLLERDQGYWPNEDNLELFATEVLRLLDWVDAESLAVAAIVYDLEPALAYSEELRVAFAEGSLDAIQTLMRTHLDRPAYEASRDTLATHVRAVQARGVRAEAVTYPQVVDDMVDGDPDLQDALDIPVDGVPFDDVAFMVYQTAFAEAQGAWIGPGLIRSYGIDARTHFGERATLALGIIGTASIIELDGPPYASPSALADDVGAALGAGIARVEVYSLDGMVELGDPSAWLAATEAAPISPPIEPRTRVVRAAAQALDEGLDR